MHKRYKKLLNYCFCIIKKILSLPFIFIEFIFWILYKIFKTISNFICNDTLGDLIYKWIKLKKENDL